MGRQGSGHRLVGGIGSEVRVSASFQIFVFRMFVVRWAHYTWPTWLDGQASLRRKAYSLTI